VNPKQVILFCCLSLLLSACTGGLQSAHFIFDGVYHIPPQGSADRLLVQFNGDTRLDTGTVFTGTTFIIEGTFELAGRYDGALTIFGGELVVAEGAQVDGLLSVGGGTVTLHPNATVRADVREGDLQIPRTTLTTGSVLLDDVLWFLLETVPLMLLSLVLSRWWRRPLARIEDALIGHPLVSAAMGLLFGIVALSLIVVIVFTIILIPVALLGLLILFLAVGVGLAAMGHILGRWLVGQLGWSLPTGVTAALGVAIVMLLLNLLEPLPIIGLMPLLVMVTGLGAVALTRMGLRPFTIFTPVSDDS
jgi:hypothetical protein